MEQRGTGAVSREEFRKIKMKGRARTAALESNQ